MRAVVERCQHRGPRMHTLVTLGGQHQGVMNVPLCDNPSFNNTPTYACRATQYVLGWGAYLPFIRTHVIQAQYFKARPRTAAPSGVPMRLRARLPLLAASHVRHKCVVPCDWDMQSTHGVQTWLVATKASMMQSGGGTRRAGPLAPADVRAAQRVPGGHQQRARGQERAVPREPGLAAAPGAAALLGGLHGRAARLRVVRLLRRQEAAGHARHRTVPGAGRGAWPPCAVAGLTLHWKSPGTISVSFFAYMCVLTSVSSSSCSAQQRAPWLVEYMACPQCGVHMVSRVLLTSIRVGLTQQKHALVA